MDIVDAHHHLWDLKVRDQDWITGEALAPLRRDFSIDDLAREAGAVGVSESVVVQTVTVAEETPEFLVLAAENELIGAVVGWTDLTAPDVGERLAALWRGAGGEYLAGIRHQVQSEEDPRWLCRPDVRRGLAAVAEAGLVYDLVIVPRQLDAATETAAALPELTFVLDHLGKPPIASGLTEPWAAAVRALAALPNTVCKLSGMVTEAAWDRWTVEDLRPYADIVLDAFGPERVMYGSDWPVCLLAASYERTLDAVRELTEGLTAAERESVFGAVATRVYGLSGGLSGRSAQ